MDTTMDRDTLGAKLLPELQQIAQTMGVEGAQKLRKAGLIDAIVAAGSSTNGGGEAKPARAKRPAASCQSARLFRCCSQGSQPLSQVAHPSGAPERGGHQGEYQQGLGTGPDEGC